MPKGKKMPLMDVFYGADTLEAAFARAEAFDMSVEPYSQVLRAMDIHDDVVMTANAFFELVALSDQSSHLGLTQQDRLFGVLKAAEAAIKSAPLGSKSANILVFPVEVLDPDGVTRVKDVEFCYLKHPSKPGKPIRVFEIL